MFSIKKKKQSVIGFKSVVMLENVSKLIYLERDCLFVLQ